MYILSGSLVKSGSSYDCSEGNLLIQVIVCVVQMGSSSEFGAFLDPVADKVSSESFFISCCCGI